MSPKLNVRGGNGAFFISFIHFQLKSRQENVYMKNGRRFIFLLFWPPKKNNNFKIKDYTANMYKYDSLLNKIGFHPFSTQYLYGFERFFCMNISKIHKCFFSVENILIKIYFFELLIHIEYSSYRMRKLPFSPMAFFTRIL